MYKQGYQTTEAADKVFQRCKDEIQDKPKLRAELAQTHSLIFLKAEINRRLKESENTQILRGSKSWGDIVPS